MEKKDELITKSKSGPVNKFQVSLTGELFGGKLHTLTFPNKSGKFELSKPLKILPTAVAAAFGITIPKSIAVDLPEITIEELDIGKNSAGGDFFEVEAELDFKSDSIFKKYPKLFQLDSAKIHFSETTSGK